MGILSVLTTKVWTSEGAVRHSDPANPKDHYYPIVGTQFKFVNITKKTLQPATVKKFKKDQNGTWSSKSTALPQRDFNIAQIIVNQELENVPYPPDKTWIGKVANPNPPDTKNKPLLFLPKFLKNVEAATFYEYGDLLISEGIAVPVETGGVTTPGTLTYVIELVPVQETDQSGNEIIRTYMLQRSFWNGNYVGTYCCG